MKLIIIICLILLNFSDGSENKSYCVVGAGDDNNNLWGIIQDSKEVIVSLLESKPTNYNASNLYKIKTFSLETISSLNFTTSLNHLMGPVFDFRWEFFSDIKITDINSTADYFFVSERDSSDKLWHHFKCESNTKINCRNSFNNESKNFENEDSYVKLHNYSYIFERDEKNLTFKLKDDDITGKGCFYIHFFINMCQGCSISVKNSNKTQTYSTDERFSLWKLHSYLVQDLTDLVLTLSLITDKKSNESYWAIGEKIYYSNYLEIVRYIQLNDLDNNKNHCTYINNNDVTNTMSSGNIEKEIEKVFNFNSSDACNQTINNINDTNDTNDILMASFSILALFLILGLIIGFCIYFFYFKKSKTDSELYQLLELEPLTKKQALNKKEYAISENWKEAESFWKKQYDDLKLKTIEFFEEYKQTVGLRPENNKKNLENGIIPLDAYRVRLSTITPQPSDYINATTIDVTQSLNIEAQYILAQNPLPQTMEDFLQMIWSQSVKYIIFLSAMDESCINYWDNYCCSQFRISRIENKETFEYFIKRTLKIEYKNEARILEQFHYDSWPIEGKPFFSWTILTFFEHLKAISVHLDNRILIHSTNIRINIGLILFCDVVQRSQIKLFEVAEELVKFYPNLFRNYEEYCLSHIFIYTMKKYRQTGINIDNNFHIELKNFMKQKNIDKVWNMNEKSFKALKKLHNYQYFIGDKLKDRYKDLALYNHSHVKLKLNQYINATYVDGYRFLQKYITTQQPLENSVYDFWQMILEQKIETIVNLTTVDYQLETCFCNFVPDEDNSPLNFRDIAINFNKIIKTSDHFEVVNIEIVQGKLTRKAIVLNVNNWFKTSKCPEKIDVIIDTYREIRERRAVICSDDGITACGLLICFGYLVEMMATEGRFDIVASVNAIRRSHDHFICKQQFVFLCEAAQHYFRLYYHSEMN